MEMLSPGKFLIETNRLLDVSGSNVSLPIGRHAGELCRLEKKGMDAIRKHVEGAREMISIGWSPKDHAKEIIEQVADEMKGMVEG